MKNSLINHLNILSPFNTKLKASVVLLNYLASKNTKTNIK